MEFSKDKSAFPSNDTAAHAHAPHLNDEFMSATASESARCVYHGPFPSDFPTKNFPLGSVDENGNCTFTWNGQTYIEGLGKKPALHKGHEGPTPPPGPASENRRPENDSKRNPGDGRVWTEEEMKNAKPTPLPVVNRTTQT